MSDDIKRLEELLKAAEQLVELEDHDGLWDCNCNSSHRPSCPFFEFSTALSRLKKGPFQNIKKLKRELDEAVDCVQSQASVIGQRDAELAALRAEVDRADEREQEAAAEINTLRAKVADLERERDRPMWTCFHCGETFTTPGGARDHFGGDPSLEPGCMIRVSLGGERGLLMALRKNEELLARYQEEDSDAVRVMRREQTRHADALMSAEDAGYARGLRDSSAGAADRDEALAGEVAALRAELEVLKAERDRLRGALGDVATMLDMDRADYVLGGPAFAAMTCLSARDAARAALATKDTGATAPATEGGNDG